MKRVSVIGALALVLALAAGIQAAPGLLPKARARMTDLRYEVYATSRQVEKLATDEEARARTWQIIERLGITKVYTEVYRSGHTVSNAHLVFVRDWLRGRGIEVTGGIATLPGPNFGVRQRGPLRWFNWQNEKTQRDLRAVIHATAGLFDALIVDDFFCTDDRSDESRAAKGDRSWGQYRRALLSELAQSVIVDPAKQVNPSITVIVKYPQWYDRFHEFGYDTQTLPQIFDKLWVGTETRGRTTQRYGYVQPYEGFVNYRWLADIAPRKIGGAWFDHGDCRQHDFLDQVYMSVLAGARELVFFNLGDLLAGHPDHQAVVAEFDQLADLAAAIRGQPVGGVPAYKPPNSDPAGDMYLMDFLGMLGIPLIPVHEFPATAPVIFLPAQAAADPHLVERMRTAQAHGARLILTTNLLTMAPRTREFARRAGLPDTVESQPIRAQVMTPPTATEPRTVTDVTVDLEMPLEIDPGPGDVLCVAGDRRCALLARAKTPGMRLSILNTHTFSQADFDAVGEVLLCPRPLGILALAGQPLGALRAAFRDEAGAVLEGPSCVTLHPLPGGNATSWVIQNYHDQAVPVTLTVPCPAGEGPSYRDGFTSQPLGRRGAHAENGATLELVLPARGRVWIQPVAEDPAAPR